VSAPLYHTAADGVTYRVHDQRFGPEAGNAPYRATTHPPPDARANYRVFVTADGTVRIYTRGPDDDWRDLAPATLEWQLQASGYLARERFDAAAHSEGAGHAGS
jgi:crotonobetainyl-CoA:carnitine CoA-transferase CaiB-like acyl-CoA transferase